MIGKTIDELKVGDTAEFTKTVSEADIYLYAGVTGDVNPVHIDEVHASNTFSRHELPTACSWVVLFQRLSETGCLGMEQSI